MRTLPLERPLALAAALTLTVILAPCGRAAPEDAPLRDVQPGCMNFESCARLGEKHGWGGGPAATLAFDSTVAHGGKVSGRIVRDASSDYPFSSMTFSLPVDFTGSKLELRGWLKYENVSDFTGFWLREDSRATSVQFDNMQQRKLAGTSDWKEHRIELPLDPRAQKIVFGFLLAGTGTVWADDIGLFVDGRPLAEAPVLVRTPAAVDTDHEFDAGSRVTSETPLSDLQIANLVTLGKVWGFVKYHHPRVTAAQLHWDYELFRVLPDVLAARDRAAAQAAIDRWLAKIGDPPACNPCAEPATDVHLTPRVDWISDRARLGEDLVRRLESIRVNRDADSDQFYVALMPGVGNPDFANESNYDWFESPDAGYRLLALFRFWNIIEYWFPYRDVMDEDWDGVLAEFVPRLWSAGSSEDYKLALLALCARVHDGHVNLWSAVDQRPPRGECKVPVTIRFLGNEAVVTEVRNPDGAGPAPSSLDLRSGDVIQAVDGTPVATLLERWRPYYGASNEPTLRREIARVLTRGDCGPVRLLREREGRVAEVTVQRAKLATERFTHDHDGETFRRLSEDLAYLKLSTVKRDDSERYVKEAAGARCFILDCRNYPNDFIVFTLGQRLVPARTEFVRFTNGDLKNPGTFVWTQPLALEPKPPHFEARVLILVDEITQSSAEYHSMAFRAAPQAVVVGSTTAGADGNASSVPFPGGQRAIISGIGVFYPDRRPTQRVGIVPDLVVVPTRAGVMAGRDEVLEAGVKHVLGRDLSDAERLALAAPVPGAAPASSGGR
ncbi:MAG: S41 family peptidase [Candidatus Eiseniibacteriota bacterium]